MALEFAILLNSLGANWGSCFWDRDCHPAKTWSCTTNCISDMCFYRSTSFFVKIFLQVVVEQMILPEVEGKTKSTFLLKPPCRKCITSTSPHCFTRWVHLVTAPYLQCTSSTVWPLLRWHWQKYIWSSVKVALRISFHGAMRRHNRSCHRNIRHNFCSSYGPCQSMVPLKYGSIELLLIQWSLLQQNRDLFYLFTPGPPLPSKRPFLTERSFNRVLLGFKMYFCLVLTDVCFSVQSGPVLKTNPLDCFDLFQINIKC